MKRTSTTIVLIVLIIGLIGSGATLYFVQQNAPVEESTTQDPNVIIATSVPTIEDNTDTSSTTPTYKDYVGKTAEISINEVFTKLDEYYGDDYKINCLDSSVDNPVFKVYNTKTNSIYSTVQVDLNTAIATEILQENNQVKEFSLYG